MTYEETIINIKGKIGLRARCELETDEERQIVWNALEKQIPKEPINIIEKRINGRRTYMCPSCKNVLVDINEQGVQWGHESIYCESCGQALDWSGEQ